MTELVDVFLPKLGESILEAKVVQWLKKEGDLVSVDEPLLEVATDKVNSEIPSPVSGILHQCMVKADETVAVGGILVKISKDITCCTVEKKQNNISPAVLQLAQQKGISLDTLNNLKGSGEAGRLTKKDLEKFIESTRKAPEEKGEERIKLSGMRKIIADNMVKSFYEAPHASLVLEADVTKVMQIISREKEKFQEKHGVKLTITTFLIQAVTRALKKFPLLNASLENEEIVMKHFVNIGIAVHIDSENGLIVPVLKNCHEKDQASIAASLSDLSSRARSGRLLPDEITGGTITITNFGMQGALIGVPIIRYPEVAIIGAGKIQKRVVAHEDNSFSIREMIYLTLTFDHRIINGIYGCQFLEECKKLLEEANND